MILFFVLFAVAIVVVLQYITAEKGLDGLDERHYPSVSATEQDELFDIVVEFKNRSRMFIPFVRFRERMPAGITPHVAKKYIYVDGKGAAQVVGTTWLRPREALEKRIPVSVDARGRYLLSDLAVYGGDFLGLGENMRTYSGINEIIAYPKRAELGKLESIFGGFLGEVSVSRFLFEDPVLTLGFREYTGREPMKMISWTQSARSGQLMVKKFDYTLEPAVSVVLNIEGSSGNKELIEEAYSLARTVCEQLEEQGIKYDFSMNALMSGSMNIYCYVAEGLGSRHFYGILECMGRATYEAVCSCAELLRRSVRSSGSAHGIIFITPEKDAAVEADAKAAAAKSGGTLLTICAEEHV